MGTSLGALAARIESVAAWLILPLVLTTFAVVALRYVFSYARIDLQEVSIYLHATILALCIAGVAQNDGHVRVDIFYRKMSARHKAMVNCFGTIIMLIPFCVVTLVVSRGYVSRSWSILESSNEAGGLPLVFLLKTLLPIMAALILLQGLSALIRNINLLFSDSS